MTRRFEWLAVCCLLAGFVLFRTMETAMLGALLVAGGTYVLLLPRLVDPGDPTSVR